MQVHPAIAALRTHGASQRRGGPIAAKAAMEQTRQNWIEAAPTQAIVRDLAYYGADAPLEDCAALARMLGDHAAASAWVESLCAGVLSALRAQPLGEAPFRHTAARGLSTLRLIEAGRAALTLAAYEPIENAGLLATALFADREAHEIVISGAARGLTHTLGEGGTVALRRLDWRSGDRIVTRALTDSRQIIAVERSLLLLQLTREPARPRATLDIALETGEVLRAASGDKAASQAVMALGVLGALGDQSALEVLETTAMNRAEDSDVRWEAVRQTLALEPKRGLKLLSSLGEGCLDPLAGPARALRCELLETRPELRRLSEERA